MWRARQSCAGTYVFLPVLIPHLSTYHIQISNYTVSISVLSLAAPPFCSFVIVIYRNLRLHYCCYLAITVVIGMASHSGE